MDDRGRISLHGYWCVVRFGCLHEGGCRPGGSQPCGQFVNVHRRAINVFCEELVLCVIEPLPLLMGLVYPFPEWDCKFVPVSCVVPTKLLHVSQSDGVDSSLGNLNQDFLQTPASKRKAECSKYCPPAVVMSERKIASSLPLHLFKLFILAWVRSYSWIISIST